MKSAKLSAIIYAVVLSLLLLIPTLMIRYVDHDARKDWENRNLSERPTITELRENPKQGFKDFDDYLNDHIGGSFQAIRFRRKFYFDVLGATGDNYIVGNNNGAYFLTAPFQQADRKTPFAWWQSICITAENSKYQQAYIKRFNNSLALLSKYDAKVVYGMVPTKSVLMPDDLPRSTPKHIVEACKKISSENNFGRALSEQAPNLDIFYPYSAFKDRISDPLFYPNTAYHWQGESSWVFAEELAKTYGLDVSPKWQDAPCQNAMVDWDIGKLVGVGNKILGCDRDRSQLGIITDQSYAYPLHEGADKTEIVVAKLTNPHATNEKTAIVFSNSFGPVVRELIASNFKTTYHLRATFISAPDMQRLFNQSDMLKADYIFVTVADFHYPAFLDWVSPADETKRMFAADAIAASEARVEAGKLLRQEAEARQAEKKAEAEAKQAEKKAALELRREELEAQRALRAEEKQKLLDERKAEAEAKRKEFEEQKAIRLQEKQEKLEQKKALAEAKREQIAAQKAIKAEARQRKIEEKKAALEARKKDIEERKAKIKAQKEAKAKAIADKKARDAEKTAED